MFNSGAPVMNIMVKSPESAPIIVDSAFTEDMPHTAENMAKLTKEKLMELDDNIRIKLTGLVTDGPSANRATWRRLADDFDLTLMYGCGAHILNNASKDVAALPYVQKTVKDLSTLISTMSQERIHQVSLVGLLV
jgi:hypothetical protein